MQLLLQLEKAYNISLTITARFNDYSSRLTITMAQTALIAIKCTNPAAEMICSGVRNTLKQSKSLISSGFRA